MDGSAAQNIYRLEKERAMQERRLSHTALMAEAKEAFNKLLADAQLARKGGRPRTNPLPPGVRPPVKAAVPIATAATAPVVAAPAPKAKAEPAKKAVAAAKPAAVKKVAEPARRASEKGHPKAASAKAKSATAKAAPKKLSAKAVSKPQAKGAKPQPKQSNRSKKAR